MGYAIRVAELVFEMALPWQQWEVGVGVCVGDTDLYDSSCSGVLGGSKHYLGLFRALPAGAALLFDSDSVDVEESAGVKQKSQEGIGVVRIKWFGTYYLFETVWPF